MKRKPILLLRLLWQLFREAASRSVVYNGILLCALAKEIIDILVAKILY